MDGYISLHRKILDSAIFKNSDYLQLWIYILLKGNYKDTTIFWNGESKLLKRGSGIFSQKQIAQSLGYSLSKVNRALLCLKNGKQIEIKSTNKYTEIQVLNWDEYQGPECKTETKRKPNGNQTETDNKDKKNINNIYVDCESLKSEYGEKMIEDFLLYWTEKSKSGLEKWQMEKTWETSKRLATWKRNSIKFGPQKFEQPSKPKSRFVM